MQNPTFPIMHPMAHLTNSRPPVVLSLSTLTCGKWCRFSPVCHIIVYADLKEKKNNLICLGLLLEDAVLITAKLLGVLRGWKVVYLYPEECLWFHPPFKSV